jgi:hypothetical protein
MKVEMAMRVPVRIKGFTEQDSFSASVLVRVSGEFKLVEESFEVTRDEWVPTPAEDQSKYGPPSTDSKTKVTKNVLPSLTQELRDQVKDRFCKEVAAAIGYRRREGYTPDVGEEGMAKL